MGLEHVAQIAGAPIGLGMARSQKYLFKLLQLEGDAARDMATALFEVVREARNMAVHDGSWVRHRSAQLSELLLILEEAALHQLKTVEFVMVKSVIIAEPWHSLARARRAMLTYSFSFLPIDLDGWHLLSDQAIVEITRTVGQNERNRRLALSVAEAVEKHQLRLLKADAVPPNVPISDLAKHLRHWPLVVTEKGESCGRLLGILTPFDIL